MIPLLIRVGGFFALGNPAAMLRELPQAVEAVRRGGR
jgi:hypothetical protein